MPSVLHTSVRFSSAVSLSELRREEFRGYPRFCAAGHSECVRCGHNVSVASLRLCKSFPSASLFVSPNLPSASAAFQDGRYINTSYRRGHFWGKRWPLFHRPHRVSVSTADQGAIFLWLVQDSRPLSAFCQPSQSRYDNCLRTYNATLKKFARAHLSTLT